MDGLMDGSRLSPRLLLVSRLCRGRLSDVPPDWKYQLPATHVRRFGRCQPFDRKVCKPAAQSHLGLPRPRLRYLAPVVIVYPLMFFPTSLLPFSKGCMARRACERELGIRFGAHRP